ncbi:MAG: C39 family peptidase [Phycisphaeraceae bacterium]
MTRALPAQLLALILLVLTGCSGTAEPVDQPVVETRPNTGRETWPASRWLNNPYRFADRTVAFDSASDWAQGSSTGLVALPTGELRLPPDSKNYPRLGTWTSPEITTDFPFTEVLPSWNLHTPEHTGVSFFIRSRDAATNEWSPWLYLGAWGQREVAHPVEIEFPGGEIKIDYLVLNQPANAYQLEARIESASLDPRATPTLRKLHTVYSGTPADGVNNSLIQTYPTVTDGWARDLPVPFRAQGIEHKSINSRICSPTSTSMVMAYFGIDLPTVTNALAIYDPEYTIFGNWHRAVAYASQHGLEGELVRIRDWDQVKAYIAEGQPLIASIRFRRGEFPSNVMESTGGHLITIRGLTPEGDAIVNDSASKDRGHAVIYKAEELARAWIGRGGVTYVIRRPITQPHGM